MIYVLATYFAFNLVILFFSSDGLGENSKLSPLPKLTYFVGSLMIALLGLPMFLIALTQEARKGFK